MKQWWSKSRKNAAEDLTLETNSNDSATALGNPESEVAKSQATEVTDNGAATATDDSAAAAKDDTVPEVNAEAEPEGTDSGIAEDVSQTVDTVTMDSIKEDLPPVAPEDEGSPTNSSDETVVKNKKWTTKKKLTVTFTVLGALVLVAGSLTAYGVYFKSRALPGTVVAGQSVWGMKPSELTSFIQKHADESVVDITGVSKAKANLKDLGVQVDSAATSAKIMERNHSFWEYVKAPFITKKYDVEYVTDYHTLYGYSKQLLLTGGSVPGAVSSDGNASDSNLTEGAAAQKDDSTSATAVQDGAEKDSNKPGDTDAAENKDAEAEGAEKDESEEAGVPESISAQNNPLAKEYQEPKFPALVPNEDSSGFVVTKPEPGRGINPHVLEEGILEAVNGNGTSEKEVKIEEFMPHRTVADLQPFVAGADKLLTHDIKIEYNDDFITPDAAERAAWVKVPDPQAPVLQEATANTEAIAAWVDKKAAENGVEGKVGQRNVDPTGRVTLVRVQAVAGVQITNKDEITSEISQAVDKNESLTAKFEAEVTPEKWEDRKVVLNADRFSYQPQEGEKWIDVNLSTLRMSAYVGGNLVQGPIKIIGPGSQYYTPVGLFHVYTKIPVQNMSGFNHDGSTYFVPDVKNVMYFYRDWAIHQSGYAREFFGTRLQGSHGCINTPTPEIDQLYAWTPIGTPVSVHH